MRQPRKWKTLARAFRPNGRFVVTPKLYASFSMRYWMVTQAGQLASQVQSQVRPVDAVSAAPGSTSIRRLRVTAAPLPL